MSQIEFIGSAGYPFTVELKNPQLAYASIVAGLAVTSPSPGVYRCNTLTHAGIVFVVATAGALNVVGFANLDKPSVNTYSEVFDTLAEAVAAGNNLTTLITDLALLNSKIQTGAVTVVSPVNQDGSINPIVIGDDYLAAHARSFDFFLDPVVGVDVNTCTCRFGGEKSHKGAWNKIGTVAAVTVNSVIRWRMRFELVSGDTLGKCLPGCYDYCATLLLPGRATKITGEVELIESQTIV